MAKNLADILSKFAKNSKGLGAGLTSILAAGGLLYGASQSIFTSQ